jgi:hypothetical protein
MSGIGSFLGFSRDRGLDGGIFNLKEQNLLKIEDLWTEQELPIISSGLVLHLDAGKQSSYSGTGTSWLDLSANSNNATLVNGVAYDPSNSGYLVFDGIDDFAVNSSTTGIPLANSSRTVQIWVYPKNNFSTFVQIGSSFSGSPDQVYIVQSFLDAGIYYLFTDGKNASNNLTFSGSDVPVVNSWNHITFGNAGQNWFYYLNGTLKRSGTFPTTLNTAGQKYVIGKRDDILSPQGHTNGNISQVAIYNRALDSTEILENFNALRDRYGV